MENRKKFFNMVFGGKRVSPLKAIRKKCLECCGYNPHETDLCMDPDCPLFAFRHEKNMTGKKNHAKLVEDMTLNGLKLPERVQKQS